MMRNKIRKSAPTRALSLFLTLLFLIDPVLTLNPAYAEKKAATKIAVATVDDASGVKVKDVALKLSDALYLAFTQSGLYEVASKEKVSEAVTSSGAAGSKDTATLAKVGKASSSDVVFSATLKSLVFPKDKPECLATVYAQGISSETGDVVAKVEVLKSSGVKPGYSGNQEFLAQEAINMAASAVVDEFFKYQTTESTVLSTQDNKFIVSMGHYQGINPGAEFTVMRKKSPAAVLKVTKVSGNDSEAILLTKKPGPPIVAGDTAKILYNPPKAVSLTKEGLPKKKKSWTTIAIGIAVIAGAALLLGKKKETTPPEEPIPTVTGVNATPSGDKITVSWTPVTYSKLASYVVYRAPDDGQAKLKPGTFVCAAEVPAGLKQFDDIGKNCDGTSIVFTPGLKYWYQVAVKSTNGTVSGFSVVDPNKTDNVAPFGGKSKPNPPTVNPPKPGGKKITLTWTPPTTRADTQATQLLSSEISGYYVYYSTTSTNFVTANRTFVAHTVGATTISVVLDQNNSIVNTNNVTYYFTVSTVDSDMQEGAQSSVLSAAPAPASPPKAPTWTKVCAATITNTATGEVDDPNCSLYPKSSEVQLTWNAVSFHKDGTCYKDDTGCAFSPYDDKLSGYNIYRVSSTTVVTDRTQFSFLKFQIKQAGTTVVFSDKTVANDTSYFYYIRALNDEGTESDLPVDNTDILGPVKPEASTTGPGQITDTPPPSPTGVTATAGIAKVTLSWKAVDTGSENDLDGYNVYMSTTSTDPQTGFTKITGTLISPSQTTYTKTGLTNGVSYNFYVTAMDKSGGNFGVALESQPSGVVAGIPQPPVPPAAPVWYGVGDPVKPVVPSTNYITLNWQSVTNDVNFVTKGCCALNTQEAPLAKYRIYQSVATDFSQGANGNYLQIAEVTVPTVSYKDTTANDPTRYYFYRIQAVLFDGTAGPLSEYRYGQVQQPAIVLYSPDKGAWMVPTTTTSSANQTLCGCQDTLVVNNHLCDTQVINGVSVTEPAASSFTYNWSATLAWSPVEGATRYIVEIGIDPAMASLERADQITGQQSNNEIYTGTITNCGELFTRQRWWRVKAVNDAGVALAISEARAFTFANKELVTVAELPKAPTNMALVGTPNPTNVTFNWTAPTCNTDGTQMNSSTNPAAACTTTLGTATTKLEDPQLYNIYWSTSADGPFNIMGQAISPSVQFTDTRPQDGVVNYYKVSTVNKGGREGPTSTSFVSANISSLAPARPIALAAVASNRNVSLTWTAPTTYSDGVTPLPAGAIQSYDILRADDINFSVNPKLIPGVTTASYTDASVTNGTTFYYKVLAKSNLGFSSAYSDVANATPLNDSPPASPQSLLIAAQDSSTKLSWSWDSAGLGQDIQGFEIYRAPWDPSGAVPAWTSPPAAPLVPVCPNANPTKPNICVPYTSGMNNYAFTDTGLENGGYYYYWVRTVNKCDVNQTFPFPNCTAPDGNKSAPAPSTGFRIKALSDASPTLAPTVPPLAAACVSSTATGVCTDTTIGKVVVRWDSSGITPGVGGAPPGVDLSGYFVYAAPSSSMLQTLMDSQKPLTTPASDNIKNATNNYYVADIPLETTDIGNPGNNGTGGPYEAVFDQFKNFGTGTTPQSMVPGTTYYVGVQPYRYVDKTGNGIPDFIQYGPVSTIIPAQPYLTTVPPAATFTTSTAGNQSVQLAWAAAAPSPDDRAGYQILRLANPPAGCNIAGASVITVIPISANLTSYTDSGLINGNTYCYWVRVVRKGPNTSASSAGPNCVCNDPSSNDCKTQNPPSGCSGYIDSPFVTLVPAGSTAPTPPTWANAAVISTALNGSPALSLTWQASAGATKYRIYRGTSQFGEFPLLAACDTSQGGVATDSKGCYIGAPTTHYIDNDGGAGLDPSTTYYYKLTAVNADGTESPFSDVRWGQPGIDSICTYTPGPNQTFVITNGASPVMNFVWCTFPGAAQYLLEVASDPSITTIYYAQTVTSPTTNNTWNSTFTVNQLPPTMYWRISVLDNTNKILTQSKVVAGGQGAFNFQIQ